MLLYFPIFDRFAERGLVDGERLGVLGWSNGGILTTALTVTTTRFKALLILGLLIGVQSQCLYSSVARLPVALALLAFNTYPLWAALWDRLFYGRTPDRSLMWAMPMILIGLALALDVLGASSGLGSSAQWAQMGREWPLP